MNIQTKDKETPALDTLKNTLERLSLQTLCILLKNMDGYVFENYEGEYLKRSEVMAIVEKFLAQNKNTS